MEDIQEKVAKTMADEDVQELMRFDPSMEVSVNGKPVGPDHRPGSSPTQQRERIANRLRVMRAELGPSLERFQGVCGSAAQPAAPAFFPSSRRRLRRPRRHHKGTTCGLR